MRRRVAGPIGRVVRGASWNACAALGLALALLALVPGRTAAQGIAGAGGAFNVQRRVSYQNHVYEQTGVLTGGSGELRLGFLRLGVRGLMGTLSGDGSALNPAVKLRTTAVTMEVALQPWMAIGATAEARRLESDAGIATWRLMGGLARIEPGLGVPGLRGVAEGVLLPSGTVSNGPKTKTAFQLTLGVSYQTPRGPFRARIGYRFERYDFEATSNSPERYEQFRGVVAEAGIRLGR